MPAARTPGEAPASTGTSLEELCDVLGMVETGNVCLSLPFEAAMNFNSVDKCLANLLSLSQFLWHAIDHSLAWWA
jgi:hypothetical protein